MKKVLYITEYDIGNFVTGDQDKIFYNCKSSSESFKIPLYFSKGIYNITIILEIKNYIYDSLIYLLNEVDYTTQYHTFNNMIYYNKQYQYINKYYREDKILLTYGWIYFMDNYMYMNLHSFTPNYKYNISSIIYSNSNIVRFASISSGGNADMTFKLLLERL